MKSREWSGNPSRAAGYGSVPGGASHGDLLLEHHSTAIQLTPSGHSSQALPRKPGDILQIKDLVPVRSSWLPGQNIHSCSRFAISPRRPSHGVPQESVAGHPSEDRDPLTTGDPGSGTGPRYRPGDHRDLLPGIGGRLGEQPSRLTDERPELNSVLGEGPHRRMQ